MKNKKRRQTSKLSLKKGYFDDRNYLHKKETSMKSNETIAEQAIEERKMSEVLCAVDMASIRGMTYVQTTEEEKQRNYTKERNYKQQSLSHE